MMINFFKLDKTYEYVLFLSMLLLLIHMWYGTYIFLKYMKLSKPVVFIGFFIVLLVISIGFLIKNMLLLFISFFFLFSLANILYRMVAKQAESKKLKDYAMKKANIEVSAIPLILVGVLILYYFPSETLKLLFAAVSIPAHLIFVYLMFVKEKIYSL